MKRIHVRLSLGAFLAAFLFMAAFFVQQSLAQEVVYGVDFNDVTNALEGKASSERAGLIDFSGVTKNPASGQLFGAATIESFVAEGKNAVLQMNGDCIPSCGGFAVTVQGDGRVTGRAWNEEIGFVVFDHPFGGVFFDAAATPAFSGYARSTELGWISMSREDLDAIPPTNCLASPFNTCRAAIDAAGDFIFHNSTDNPSSPIFGIHIDKQSAEVSGEAWNDYLGYIDFSTADFDPVTGQLSGDAHIQGFAANSEVSLRGDCVPSCGGYGVQVQGNLLTGHAWNDVIGWIDFQSDFEVANFYEQQKPSVTGWAFNDSMGWIALRFTVFDEEYGVQIEEDGNLTGLAFSETLGFIDYDAAGPFPTAPQQSVQWDEDTQEVSGWAEIIGFNKDESLGFIKFRSTGADAQNFATNINPTTGDWSGTAFSDQLGLIQFDHGAGDVFSKIEIIKPATPELVSPVACIDTYDVNPVAPLTPVLDWTDYQAADDSVQVEFHIQVDDDPLFGSPEIDEFVASAGSQYTVGLGELAYNITYYWRVRVKSSTDFYSDFGETGVLGEQNCFRTPSHPAPACSFFMNPAQPVVGGVVKFNDTTQTFGGAAVREWDWDFGDGEGLIGDNPAEHQNPEHTYSSVENLQVRLHVTDTDGYECIETLDVSVIQQLPEFRRVIPR